MNVSFNSIIFNSFDSIKQKLAFSLSPIQKKVALVALAIFSSLCLLYIAYNFWFREKKIEKEDQGLPKVEQKAKQDHPSNPEEIEGNPSKPLSLLPLPKQKPDIATRLETNRKLASAQQNKQTAKGFAITAGQVPPILYYNRPLHSEQVKVGKSHGGSASCQGIRSEMEDADLAVQGSFKVEEDIHAFDVFGVFDGHGGNQASAFVKNNLQTYLERALVYHCNAEGLTDKGIFKALKEAFQNLDDAYEGIDGTTATVALVLNGKIWVANVGDARTILVTNGKVTQASEDAKPGMERYKKTIEKLGGKVIKNRVMGAIGVARAIGDKGITGESGVCCISPNPKITSYPLEDFKEGYLVLACDGLYDVATTNEVGAAIQQMAGQKMTEEEMAQHLVHSALTHRSSDNVSVMVIKL